MRKASGDQAGTAAGVVRTVELSTMTAAERLARNVRRFAGRAELRLAVRRTALDPSAREFADRVKADLASGAIHHQVAAQTELRTLIEEHGH
jgi:hypothetical protein